MKVYVETLPKSCDECGFCCRDDLGYWCQGSVECGVYIADKIIREKRLQSCPLQSLSDYTKQVRKEVCDEIRNKLKENGLLYTWKGVPKYKTMEELLDQIQGERNERNKV